MPQSTFKIDRWLFRGANLCAWEGGLKSKLRNRDVIIDPVIGRILIGVNTVEEGNALFKHLLITFAYGSVGPIGSHPINHLILPKEEIDSKVGPIQIINVNLLNGETIQKAFDSIKDSTSPLVIEINDSMTHDLDIASVAGVDPVDKSLKIGNSLVIKSGDNQRPIIRLVQPLKFSPRDIDLDGKSNLDVRLEGLYLTKSEHFTSSTEPLISQVALDSLEIINCTLDPGSFRKMDGSIAPNRISLELDIHYGFAADSENEKAFNKIPKIIIRRSITGPIFIEGGPEGYSLSLIQSIIDAGRNNTDINAIYPFKKASFAVSGSSERSSDSWGPPTDIQSTTILGNMRVESINGRGNIWKNSLEVWDNQKGCLKFSCFNGRGHNRMPQNYGCVNVNGESIKLHFTSEDFGEPGYGQLGYQTDFRIKERGPGDNEMGAYGFLEEANKWRNIRIRFREFMPIGVKPLLIPVT